MRKPLIGVTPLWDSKMSSIWMLPGYMDGLVRAGALPFILPLTKDKGLLRQAASEFDGLLFTGGQDCDPSLYGEENRSCHEICSIRDEMEKILFEEALKLDLPVFGICRGIQLINALLLGSLWQDIPTECPSGVSHSAGPPYGQPTHSVKLSGWLKDLLGQEEISVNSYHHQGVKKLSPKLTSCAVSPDGIVEAVRMPGRRFVAAVQWHPEFMLEEENSKKLFEAFVEESMRK
ncbi:MAG: gamma-glutamyl-gamma-aminobutyrate hydrolase family protein [Clostridiales bacterium]|nr:gamma-glutamyl-gamma-aminobutyrate hydrolase family protein [Clostridiales bacterium]